MILLILFIDYVLHK